MMMPVSVGADEASLVRQAAGGSESAFETLIAPLADPAFRLAMTILRDRGEAEDAVQEATLKAWRSIHQVRDRMPVRPWFLTVVANQCRSMLRRGWRRRAWLDAPVGEPRSLERPGHDDVIRDADLRRALADLGVEDRLALHLFFYQDLPLDEAARVLGVSVSAARSRIYRAARRLRPALEFDEVIR